MALIRLLPLVVAIMTNPDIVFTTGIRAMAFRAFFALIRHYLTNKPEYLCHRLPPLATA
jgi:hypothetical protein